jgi:hypothetical protein
LSNSTLILIALAAGALYLARSSASSSSSGSSSATAQLSALGSELENYQQLVTSLQQQAASTVPAAGTSVLSPATNDPAAPASS